MAKITLSDMAKLFKDDKKQTDFHYYGQIVSVDRENRTYEVSINRDESITVEAARLVGAGVGDTVMVTVMANGYATVTGRVGGDMDASDAQRTADNASTAASNALSQANSAVGTATQAQSRAGEALSIANNAVDLAEQAEEEAGRASTAAEQAAASASSAEADASRAATSAANAEADASSASTSAQNAAASASSAATSAQNAASDASSAATSASNAASDAASAATSAQNAASDASSAATSASNAASSASSASTSASNAATSAQNAASDAATASQQSSAATTAANQAKAQAQAAETAATEAKADASTAKTQAAAANTAANGAVAGLAVVQGVVDQLETDVDDMQTHVAMMNAIDDGDVHIPAGLHVVPSASGYFMVIANDGVYVYDNESVLVAKYGHNIVYDSNREHKIGNNTSYIRYYDSNNDGVADAIEIVADNIRLGSYSVGDKITATETTLNNYMSSNNTRVGNVETSITTTTTNLTNYITSNNQAIENLQDQIDGSIQTWFYEVVPTNDNPPANSWTTTELKNNHLGDLYYDTITGYCYRYQVQNNVYGWQRITDVDVTKALADAAKAQDTADHKRRVFVTTPVPPYEIGDLWVQGQNGDIFRCATPKTSQQSYDAADWVKASKYTDDTKANAVESDLHTNYYVKSDFSVAPDQIASTISATETTVKTYADGKANAAETNAKTYADGKASTAESNAKTYADNNFDPVGSAASALDDAKDYADDNFDSKGSASAAQAAAISAAAADATSKANAAESNAKADTANKLTSYYTKTETVSEIEQRAEEISISVTKEIKDETIYYYLASNKSSGVKITDPGWTRTPQTTTDEKPYLWVYAIVATGSKTEPPEPTLISAPIVSFESEAADLPLNKLEIKIDPQQDLHGYDRPWAPGGSANKYEPQEGSYNGVTFTAQNDGTVLITGTALSTSWCFLSRYVDLPYNGISAGDNISIYSDAYLIVQCIDANNTVIRTIDSTNSRVSYDSVPDNTVKFRLLQYPEDRTTEQGTTFNMIAHYYIGKDASGTFNTWEPYSNICPIGGWNEVSLNRSPYAQTKKHAITGKNLYNAPSNEHNVLVPMHISAGAKITVSGKTNASGGSPGFRYYNANKEQIDYWTALTIDAGNGRKYRTVTVLANKGDVEYFEFYGFSDGMDDFMVELGSTCSPYEPYGETYLLYDGINVWDEEWELGYWDASNGNPVNVTSEIRSKNFIPVKPGMQYYGAGFPQTASVIYYDSSKHYLGWGRPKGVFNTPANTAYVNIDMGGSYGTTYNHDISINYPSTDHDYHPYKAGTVYGGTIDVLTGVMTIDRAYLCKNTADMNTSEEYPGWHNSGVKDIVGADKNTLFNDGVLNIGVDYGVNTTGVSDTLILPVPKYGKAKSEWQELAMDIQFTLPLAEPQTIQLTPHQINTFLGQNNIWANAGDTTVEYWSRAIPSALYLSGTDDSTDGEKIVSRINLQPETIKIQAKNIEIDGTVTFNAIKSQTDAAYDSIGSASTAEQNAKGYADGKASTAETNAKTYADGLADDLEDQIPTNVSELNNDSGFQNSSQVGAAISAATSDMATNTGVSNTYAAKTAAVAEEQYIYKSAVSGTNTMSGTTTWVSDATGAQNTWTTKRPQYNSSYPVLFVAKQKKTVSDAVTCTTPVKDDTTTVIDGGHITTGTIDASVVTVNNIDASKITTGTLSADYIETNGLYINSTHVDDLDDLLVAKQDAGDYITDSDFDERISDIASAVNTLNGQILFGDDGTNTFILLQNHVKDNPESVTGVQAKLTSGKLAFGTFGSVDNEVAYFSSEELKVQKRLSFGNFVMKQRENGHLSIMFEGGDD